METVYSPVSEPLFREIEKANIPLMVGRLAARPYRPKAGLASGTGGHCGKKCVYKMGVLYAKRLKIRRWECQNHGFHLFDPLYHALDSSIKGLVAIEYIVPVFKREERLG